VLVWVATPVPVLVTFTDAPGIVAPVGSDTCPVIEPVWAIKGRLAAKISSANKYLII
jgi:hypothetical protein